jgi:hypothetical protein
VDFKAGTSKIVLGLGCNVGLGGGAESLAQGVH